MTELDVNANAYYTLRSRLNLKIEEFLMGQLESPRTDVLRKVANINEVLFTKKKAISVATLKKLEKEVKNSGLTIIPLVLFTNEKGLAKVDIALCRGKKEYDKREVIKERDSKKQLSRIKKAFNN